MLHWLIIAASQYKRIITAGQVNRNTLIFAVLKKEPVVLYLALKQNLINTDLQFR